MKIVVVVVVEGCLVRLMRETGPEGCYIVSQEDPG